MTPGRPLKIGLVSGYTGPHASMAKNQLLGAQLATEEVNQVGFSKREFQILTRDDAMDPGKAYDHTKELIEKEGVEAVFGTFSASTVIEANRACVERGVLFFGICQTNIMTDQGHLGPYSFHESLTPHITAQMVARWGVEHLGKRWYFIAYDFQFGKDVMVSYNEIIPKLGGEVLGLKISPMGTTIETYESWFLDILSLKPDVLCINNFGLDQINALKAVSKSKLTKELSVVSTISDLFVVGKASLEELVGTYFSVNFYWDVKDNLSVKKFTDKFCARYPGEIPSGYAAYAYSAVKEFALAFKEGGGENLDKDLVVKFLEGRNYDHYKGRQWWRPCDHQSFQDIYMMRFKGPETSLGAYDIAEVLDKVTWDLDMERSCQILGHHDHLTGHLPQTSSRTVLDIKDRP